MGHGVAPVRNTRRTPTGYPADQRLQKVTPKGLQEFGYHVRNARIRKGWTLVVALAYEFAGGRFLDLQTAYTGLRNALQAAADMRAELDRLHNMDDALTAILRRVADLNDQNLREEAGQVLDAAIKAKEDELDTLHDAALQQDRLLNRPAAAAARLIARLRAAAPPGGLFNATQRLVIETLERGEGQGDPFDLTLALELAKANHDRAKRPQVLAALTDLGSCHRSLGERQSGGGHLTRARNAHSEALRMTSRQRDPQNWATAQDGFGSALSTLGDRIADPALLEQSIAAHRAALTVHTPQATPMDWAMSQNNLGIALRTLGERTTDPALLEQAIAAHRAALSVHTPEATPMLWAMSQNNLGLALQALGEQTADPALLEQAVAAHRAALTVHTRGATPMDWAMSQNNLGLALCWLGAVTHDPAMLEGAASAYADCLTKRTRDAAPFLWAKTQWNLSYLALARHALTPDPAHLATAHHHLALAREVFADEANNHQLAECDRLQALIDAG